MRLTTALLESCAGESEGEFSSIVASPLVFLPSLDQPARPGKHLRRNRQADLLRGFEIDHQLRLRRLLDGSVGGLRAFQNFADHRRFTRCYAAKPQCWMVRPSTSRSRAVSEAAALL
jgi:hypothetical protein